MALLLISGALGACATPAQRADEAARALGLERSVIRGDPFQHVIFARESLHGAQLLHVYVEGDGSPARAARSLPPDPTPRDPLMLQLLALDPGPSLLLGRPCYHGAEPCSPWHWSAGRYGEDVVDSMVAALRALLAAEHARELVLIGHSGGGALVMLMAERLPETRALVTVAGNLDVAAWVRHHGYTPLAGSLDPAQRPPLPASVLQLHLLGGRDGRVPPEVTAREIARQPGAERWRFPEFGHHCCWPDVWPAVLSRLDEMLAARTRSVRPR